MWLVQDPANSDWSNQEVAGFIGLFKPHTFSILTDLWLCCVVTLTWYLIWRKTYLVSVRAFKLAFFGNPGVIDGSFNSKSVFIFQFFSNRVVVCNFWVHLKSYLDLGWNLWIMIWRKFFNSQKKSDSEFTCASDPLWIRCSQNTTFPEAEYVCIVFVCSEIKKNKKLSFWSNTQFQFTWEFFWVCLKTMIGTIFA